jgi:heptosyltransferase-2
LADLLKKRWTCKILLFIGPGEEEIARSILSYTEAEIIDTGPDRIDLALLKYFIQQCNLLITNDTGPRHYAVALGIPVVVLMGPTDPRYTAENLEKTVVLRRDIDCAPCHKKICPTDHRCMREISPQTVFQESEKLLGKSG